MPDASARPSVHVAVDDEAGTETLAASLAAQLSGGEWLLLEGELGAGKTTFARALLVALGHPAEEIASPSYGLLHEHQGSRPAVHADLYRLSDSEELDALGLLEWEDPKAVVVVEWGARFPELRARGDLLLRLCLPEDTEAAPAGDGRRIVMLPLSPTGTRLAAALG